MLQQDIQPAIDSGIIRKGCILTGGIDCFSVSFLEDEATSISMNPVVALPIEAVSSSFDPSIGAIEIHDTNNNVIGYLCFCIDLDVVSPSQLSNLHYAAYLTEASLNTISQGDPYQFERDHVVIFESCLRDYVEKYKDTSSLWGGYTHKRESSYRRLSTTLMATADISFPTSFHSEASNRSVFEPYAFERYLKIYHLLELIFDYHIVQKIRNISDDLRGIGQLLSEHNSGDLPRLKKIIADRCLDLSPIATCLDGVFAHQLLAKPIFFEYGKEGNPIKNPSGNAPWETLVEIGNKGGFVACMREDPKRPLVHGFSSKNIGELAAYFIYRIRCCIAHNKIGEYILTHNQEDFVVEFGEPLIRAVLLQVLKK